MRVLADGHSCIGRAKPSRRRVWHLHILQIVGLGGGMMLRQGLNRPSLILHILLLRLTGIVLPTILLLHVIL